MAGIRLLKNLVGQLVLVDVGAFKGDVDRSFELGGLGQIFSYRWIVGFEASRGDHDRGVQCVIGGVCNGQFDVVGHACGHGRFEGQQRREAVQFGVVGTPVHVVVPVELGIEFVVDRIDRHGNFALGGVYGGEVRPVDVKGENVIVGTVDVFLVFIGAKNIGESDFV